MDILGENKRKTLSVPAVARDTLVFCAFFCMAKPPAHADAKIPACAGMTGGFGGSLDSRPRVSAGMTTGGAAAFSLTIAVLS